MPNYESLNWARLNPEPDCPLGAKFEATTPRGAHYLLVPNAHKPEFMFLVRVGNGKSPAGWYREDNGKIRKVG